MTIRGFLIRIDGWCIVGVGGDTESGDSWKRCPMDIGSLGLVEALSASCEPKGNFWICHYIQDGPLFLGVSQWLQPGVL
jgi:hypothetical protein